MCFFIIIESSGDDGKRQRKRPKKETSDEAGLYRVHPLKLVLHIYDDETPDPKSHKLVMLTFEYLLKLNLVCVGIEESQEDILCDLFPDDAGLEPPHQVHIYALRSNFIPTIFLKPLSFVGLVNQAHSW